MNQDAVINKLLQLGVISRTETRGKYSVKKQAWWKKRDWILAHFAIEVSDFRYVLNVDAINEALRELRTIQRACYHTGGRNFVDSALRAIPADEDGVVRSFGIEYEIYSLTPEQEDKLAYLLDTMPEHVTERDGSLSNNGVEIIFAPVSREKYIWIVNTMKQFIIDNEIEMSRYDREAGMHTTYGVSNSAATRNDMQIRLNRFALAVKASSTQGAIRALFGRDFGHYRELPSSLNSMEHSNAFSCNGRPNTCWECRLPNWRCDPEKMADFFKLTEAVFHRPVNGNDFMKVFELLGSTTAE